MVRAHGSNPNPTMIGPLQTLLAELERDPSWQSPERLRERIEALDRIERAMLYVPTVAAGSIDPNQALLDRAEALQARLEAINQDVYRDLREDLRCGVGARRLLQYASDGVGPDAVTEADVEAYDHLDALLSEVLQFEPPQADGIEPAAEMVFYQPTPARHIFDLIARLRLDAHDLLIDLGAGLGHLPLVVAACTPSRSLGVELEAAYVEIARRSARGLNLDRAGFIQADARAADLSAGTVFYLYTPFTGSVLRSVLDTLRGIALARAIRVCTLGPCTAMIAAEPWLRSDEDLRGDRIVLWRSVPSYGV